VVNGGADVVIVGAGAAGLATAIFLRRLDPAVPVTVVDTARRPGAKILVSGGSRCNVTNSIVTERDYWGGSRAVVRRVLRALPVPDTVAFFADLGVPLHEEPGGKLFPDSNRSRDVLEALLRGLDRCGARLVPGCRVTALGRRGPLFDLQTTAGPVSARHVVLATGGQSLPKSGSDGHGYAIARSMGHTIVPTTPALVPLLLDEDAVREELSGVSHEVTLAVRVGGSIAIRLTGPLLWTHFGVSGPVVLDASRHWLRARLEGREARVTASFLPGGSFESIDRRATAAVAEHPRMRVRAWLARSLPASVAGLVLSGTDVPGDTALAHLSREARRRLSHALAEWPLPVRGSRGYNFAEATAGGVDLREIDPATMESRVAPGLFLVGEILDVDGRIGGFNFQWAWASGRTAAGALAKREFRERTRDASGSSG
jgi:predicted Rossmann fold flavoprotein